MTPAFAFLLLAVICAMNAGLCAVEGQSVAVVVSATFAIAMVAMAISASRGKGNDP